MGGSTICEGFGRREAKGRPLFRANGHQTHAPALSCRPACRPWRGQDLRLVEHQSLLRVVRPRGYTPRVHPSMVSAELFPLHTLLPCGIIRADLASCWRGAVGARLVQEGRTGGFPP